ncbi:hypothetical protein D9M68_968230 [compost metagenome]
MHGNMKQRITGGLFQEVGFSKIMALIDPAIQHAGNHSGLVACSGQPQRVFQSFFTRRTGILRGKCGKRPVLFLLKRPLGQPERSTSGVAHRMGMNQEISGVSGGGKCFKGKLVQDAVWHNDKLAM